MVNPRGTTGLTARLVFAAALAMAAQHVPAWPGCLSTDWQIAGSGVPFAAWPPANRSLLPGQTMLIRCTLLTGLPPAELWGNDWENVKYSTATVTKGPVTDQHLMRISCDSSTFELVGSDFTDNEESDELSIVVDGPRPQEDSLGRLDCDKAQQSSLSPQGASVTTEFGVSLAVQPGAVAQETPIQILNTTPIPAPEAVAAEWAPITEAYAFEPRTLRLLSEATIMINYSDGEARGVDETTIRAHAFNAEANTWELHQLSQVDPHTNTLTFWTQQFGVFGFTGSPVPTHVLIDIRPGELPNVINPASKGLIPVGLITTDSLHAIMVDPLSVRLGPGGAAEVHGTGHFEDVNGDGRSDMLLHFGTQESAIPAHATAACLTGTTSHRWTFQGCDSVQIAGK
jgi:hypothetical protein